MDPFTTRWIYDSDDENWKENRKKSLHDPMNVQKDSNKDFGESSKSKFDKIHQKGRKEVATIVFEISKTFSKRISYVSWIFKNCYHVSDNKFNT